MSKVAARVDVTAVAALLMSAFMPQASLGAESRSVYLPLMFFTEADQVRTTACLPVIERKYAQSDWLKTSPENAAPPERALAAVLSAMDRKDRAALLQLSDPQLGRGDIKQFDLQAGAFFQQMQVIEKRTVVAEYELDGLAVFFLRIEAKGRAHIVPFIFARQHDGGLGFLPYRTERLSLSLVEDWATSPWGYAGDGSPEYCSQQTLQHMTHQVPLIAKGETRTTSSPALLLAGGPLTAATLAPLSARITAILDQMKADLAKDRWDAFSKHLTGADQLLKWQVSAEKLERDAYKAAFTQQKPFFIFDAQPLVIVYTTTPAGIKAMYFINRAGELQWTNASHVTRVDQVFKRGLMIQAASAEPPFATLVIASQRTASN